MSIFILDGDYIMNQVLLEFELMRKHLYEGNHGNFTGSFSSKSPVVNQTTTLYQ